MKGDSLEGSAHTPMYNPHIIPLINVYLSGKCNINTFIYFYFSLKLKSPFRVMSGQLLVFCCVGSPILFTLDIFLFSYLFSSLYIS